MTLTKLEEAVDADCVILAVAHKQFKEMSLADIDALFKKKDDITSKVLIDVKGALNRSEMIKAGYRYWRL